MYEPRWRGPCRDTPAVTAGVGSRTSGLWAGTLIQRFPGCDFGWLTHLNFSELWWG